MKRVFSSELFIAAVLLVAAVAIFPARAQNPPPNQCSLDTNNNDCLNDPSGLCDWCAANMTAPPDQQQNNGTCFGVDAFQCCGSPSADSVVCPSDGSCCAAPGSNFCCNSTVPQCCASSTAATCCAPDTMCCGGGGVSGEPACCDFSSMCCMGPQSTAAACCTFDAQCCFLPEGGAESWCCDGGATCGNTAGQCVTAPPAPTSGNGPE